MDKTTLLAIVGLGGLAIHFMVKKAKAAEEIPKDLVYIPKGMIVPPEKELETIEVPIQSISPTVPVSAKIVVEVPKILKPVSEPIPRPIPKPVLVPLITPTIPILITKPIVEVKPPIDIPKTWELKPVVITPIPVVPVPEPIPGVVIKPIIPEPVPVVEVIPEPEPEILKPKPEILKPVPIAPVQVFKPVVIAPERALFSSPTNTVIRELEPLKGGITAEGDQFDKLMYDVAHVKTEPPKLLKYRWCIRIKDLYVRRILQVLVPDLHKKFDQVFNMLIQRNIKIGLMFKSADGILYRELVADIRRLIEQSANIIYQQGVDIQVQRFVVSRLIQQFARYFRTLYSNYLRTQHNG